MLPRGPANAPQPNSRDPLGDSHASDRGLRPSFASARRSVHTARLGVRGPYDAGARYSQVPVGFRPPRSDRRWPFTSRIFQALPRVPQRGGIPLRAARDNRSPMRGALCLSCGTSPERIAPESLTRSLSDFVHGHISWRQSPTTKSCNRPDTMPSHEAELECERSAPKTRGMQVAPGSRAARTAITASSRRPCRGCGTRDKLRRLHDTEPDRRWNRGTVRDHDARAGDRREPHFDVAQLHEVLDRGAIGNMPSDRREAHGADHRRALIAFSDLTRSSRLNVSCRS